MAGAKLIGLVGVGGAGKCSVTRRLTDVHGFKHLNFGDALRDGLSAMFGFTETEFDNHAKKQPLARFDGHTLHNMMNSLFHDWGRRQVHSNIWTREYLRRLDALDGYVVTDDIQRENEVAAIREAGGIVVRVTRPGWEPRDRGVLERQARLVSDLELVNEGLEGLCRSVDLFVDQMDQTLAQAMG
jgi:hypothetical protein